MTNPEDDPLAQLVDQVKDLPDGVRQDAFLQGFLDLAFDELGSDCD